MLMFCSRPRPCVGSRTVIVSALPAPQGARIAIFGLPMPMDTDCMYSRDLPRTSKRWQGSHSNPTYVELATPRVGTVCERFPIITFDILDDYHVAIIITPILIHRLVHQLIHKLVRLWYSCTAHSRHVVDLRRSVKSFKLRPTSLRYRLPSAKLCRSCQRQ